MNDESTRSAPRESSPHRADHRAGVFRPGELRRVALDFSAFFLILCSYYILRPVRDEMAVRFGADKLQWLFSATFVFTLLVVPLFGWVVRSLPRHRLLPLWAAEIDCTSWAQMLLKFVISHPAMTCAIPATSRIVHLRDNMQAGYGRMPDEAMRERIAQAAIA